MGLVDTFRRLRSRQHSPQNDTERLLDLLFPDGLTEHHDATVRARLGDRDPFTPEAIRDVLHAVEHQLHHSRIQVRWGAGDVDLVDMDGYRLAVERADPLGTAIASGGYEPHVAAALRSSLQPGDTFVDIGANVGAHTFTAAQLVGPAGHVVAIEANPENARLLIYTAMINELSNVDVLPVACSNKMGNTYFTNMVGSNGGLVTNSAVDDLSTGRGFVVPTVRLDDVGIDTVNVIKIDVEGAEGLVVEGGADLIERHRPTVISELSFEMLERVSGVTPRSYLGWFTDLGYDVSIIDRESTTPTSIVTVDDLIANWGDASRIEDLLLQPR